MSFLSDLAAEDFADAGRRLPPRGRAQPTDPDSNLASVLGGLGDPVFSLHAAAVQFLEREADPYYTLTLLPDWEQEYGLPDPCTPLNATLDQRRGALLSKIAAIGGQSIAYFVSFAAALGYAITITEFRPFRLGVSHFGDAVLDTPWTFAWQVHAPSITVRRFRFGASAIGEPFWTIDNTELECRLRAIAPAHAVLLFDYA